MSKLDEIIRAIREDAYEDGQNGAGHPASIEKNKDSIKDLIQELIDTSFPAGGRVVYDFWKKIEKL